MAVLTWRNVDAPDFGGVLRGFRNSGDMLTNAANTWNDQIRAFAEQDRSAAALLESEQRRAVNAEALIQNQYNNARTRQTDSLGDAAAPALAQAFSAAQANDPVGFQKFMTDPAVRGMRPDQLIAAYTAGNKQVDSVLSQQGKVFDNTGKVLDNVGRGYINEGRVLDNIGKGYNNQGQLIENEGGVLTNKTRQLALNKGSFEFGNTLESDRDRRIVEQDLNDIQANNALPESIFAAVEKLRGSRTPQQFSALQAAIGKGSLPSSSGSSAPGTAGTNKGNAYDVVLGFGKFGTPSKPVSQMSLGEAIKFGTDTLIPATRDNAQLGLSGGKGSSAVGAYQFTQSTLKDYGPKVLGKDWESQPLNAENQEKLAEAIYNDRKGGNLKETWAGLTNTTPGAYKNVPWSEARKEIVQRETGMDISVAAVRDAASMIRGATSDVENTGINARLSKAEGSAKSPAEVSADLAKEPGFDKWNEKQRADTLLKVMRDAKTNNPAVAAELMKVSIKGGNAGWSPGGFMAWFTGQDSNWTIDDDALKANIAQLRGGDSDRGVATAANIRDFDKSLKDAQEKSLAKQATLSTVQSLYDAGRTGVKGDLDKATQEALEAQSKVEELLQRQSSTSTLNPDRAGQTEARQQINTPPPAPAPAAPQPVARTGGSFDQSKSRNEARAVLTTQNPSAAKELMKKPEFAMLLPSLQQQIQTIANRG